MWVSGWDGKAGLCIHDNEISGFLNAENILGSWTTAPWC
jgi:hypothetical protein